MTLDQFYEKDPLNFFLYNAWDTVLAYRIDKKAALIDLYNILRRKMQTPMSSALRGSSPLFDTDIYSILKESGKYVRYGISSENSFSISAEEIRSIPKPKSKKPLTWNIESIDSRECGKILNKFFGALKICTIIINKS